MSADLFAAFGDLSQDQQQQQPAPSPGTASIAAGPLSLPGHPTSSWDSFPVQQASSGPVDSDTTKATHAADSDDDGDGDDDTWGDFEVASPAMSSQPSDVPPPRAAPAASAYPPPRTRVVRALTIDLVTNNLLDLGALPGPALGSVQEVLPELAPATERLAPPAPKDADPNVLFDADDFDPDEQDDDDGFGDFETVAIPAKPAAAPLVLDILSSDGDFETMAPPAKPAAAPAVLDILSSDWQSHSERPTVSLGARKLPPSQLLSTLNLDNPTALYPQAPRSPSFQERNPFPGLAVATPAVTPRAAEFAHEEERAASPSPVTAWPALDERPLAKAQTGSFEGDWGTSNNSSAARGKRNGSTSGAPLGWDWDTADAVTPRPGTAKHLLSSTPGQSEAAAATDPDWAWDADDSSEPAPAPAPAPAMPDDIPPPTNIPPPSVLLSIFTALLDLPSTALFAPTAGQPSAVRARILSDPRTIDFLRGFLLLATVAARIMAGRKLRWHRDKFLAQGMAISAAGGKGGMKLAGVDRAQAARDDREAADVLAAWRQHVGRLRSAVAAANSTIAEARAHLRIPELGEHMAAQAAQMALAAPRPCLVCGLKRDERIKGVDVAVEDSFGEWWVEHWGHRACRNFWLEHEAKLRSR